MALTLSQSAIEAISSAVWNQQLPLGAAPIVTYGTVDLSPEDLTAIAYAVWSQPLPESCSS